MLANMGHKVTWWSSNFSHSTKSFRSQGQARIEVSENLHIILLNTPSYSRNISLKRLWNHYQYGRALRAEGTKCTEIPDIILATSPPLDGARAALALARRFDAKCIVDVRDIWPEVFEIAFPRRLGHSVRILLSPLKRDADRMYDKADAIIAVSQTYLQRALSVSSDKAKLAMVVPLGVNLDLYRDSLNQPAGDMPYNKQDSGEFWAIYTGTIGKNYDIKTILESADKLSCSHPNIRFFLTGDGPGYDTMRGFVQEKGLDNVTFTGLLGYHQLAHLTSQCDTGINAIAASSKITLSNKFVGYLVSGLPVVSSVRGEIEGLLNEEHVGLQYEAGNSESLAKAVLDLYDNPQERFRMGQNARRLAEERFNMNKEYPKLAEFLEAVASKTK